MIRRTRSARCSSNAIAIVLVSRAAFRQLGGRSTRKPLCVACARPGGFFRPIPRRRVRLERAEQAAGGGGYRFNGCKECRFVRFRRLVEAADFSHELKRSLIFLHMLVALDVLEPSEETTRLDMIKPKCATNYDRQTIGRYRRK